MKGIILIMKTALTIKNERIKKGITQLELANLLGVTDRAVSRWERGVGLPDASLWNDLSNILGISIEVLLNGYEESKNKSINTLKSKLYYCPHCHNIVHSFVSINANCCGQILKEEKLNMSDYEYEYSVEKTDGEYYIKINHPMKKDHYISSVLALSYNKTLITKLYPEQTMEIRVPLFAKDIYIYDTKLGLFKLINR